MCTVGALKECKDYFPNVEQLFKLDGSRGDKSTFELNYSKLKLAVVAIGDFLVCSCRCRNRSESFCIKKTRSLVVIFKGDFYHFNADKIYLIYYVDENLSR